MTTRHTGWPHTAYGLTLDSAAFRWGPVLWLAYLTSHREGLRCCSCVSITALLFEFESELLFKSSSAGLLVSVSRLSVCGVEFGCPCFPLTLLLYSLFMLFRLWLFSMAQKKFAFGFTFFTFLCVWESRFFL